MAKKKRRQRQEPAPVRRRHPTYWMIFAALLLVVCLGLLAKILFSGASAPTISSLPTPTVDASAEAFDPRVQLVASHFKCACGGCNELPLIECDCSMPRGAQEEKRFIRTSLDAGLTVDEVIDLVDKTYGLKIS